MVTKGNLDIQPLRLSDTFGLQVMVAALSELVEFEFTRHYKNPLHFKSTFQEKLLKFEGKLYNYSSLLCVPEAAKEIAQTVTIKDFQFYPAELFKYQRLVFFVSTDRPDLWPLVDRETPIARNKDLGGAQFLFELVDDWMSWRSKKDSAPDPADSSRYESDVRFGLFQHFTRDLWGGGSGCLINGASREFDSTLDAAGFAIWLQREEGKSRLEAVGIALEKYTRISKSEAAELNYGHVVSHSDASAVKKVIRAISSLEDE